MSGYRRMMLGQLAKLGPRFLPFADVANERVPLSRLLRLSLFQVSVGVALVLLVGTLNRVMIVELAVPASIVGVMLALPVLFAPFRALIGFKSDNHRSAFGWRRVPYIWKGTLLQFGGFAVMPFALLVLSGFGESYDLPPFIGQASAGVAFLLVGAGLHMVQTVGLALATDLVEEADQPRVVGLMYVMLLVGMIVSAFLFGLLLEPYNPGRLVQVIQGAAVITVVLNGVALWKQEARDPVRAHAMKTAETPRFGDAWRSLSAVAGFRRLLVAIALGTAGFGMADVLLEPFGGQILSMSVAATTRLSMALAFGSLLGFGYASRTLGRGANPLAVSGWGALIGVGGFVLVMGSASALAAPLLALATMVAGFGAGLFSHGTLTASMRAAPKHQVGLALGAWGAVQTTAAGVAIAVGGVIRDGILAAPISVDPATPYLAVFGVEIALLALALAATWRMMTLEGAVARNEG